MKQMKKPFLSTDFSENGKNAKKRIDNILTPTVKSAGLLLLMCVIMLLCILNTAVKRDKTEPAISKSAVAAVDSPLYMNPELSQTYSESLNKNDLVQILFEKGNNVYYVRRAVTELPNAEGFVSGDMLSFEYERANQGILLSDTVYKSKDKNKPAGYKIEKGETVCVIDSIDGEWAKITLPGGISGMWIPESEILYDLAYDSGASSGHYETVKAYMQKHYTAVYSKYYDNTIVNKLSNYKETFDEQTGRIEATFSMNASHMNYYKDPDTVEYIKKAKESGDENYYQTLYREYNQLHDGNYELMLKADLKDGKIIEKSVALYSDVAAKGAPEWVELKNGLKDFIIE